MSFILPRRLTQFARCAKSAAPKEAKQGQVNPARAQKATRAREYVPRPVDWKVLNLPLLWRRLLRLWLIRMVGRRRRSRHRRNGRWLLYRLGLRFILALLLVGESSLVACNGRRLFLLFPGTIS